MPRHPDESGLKGISRTPEEPRKTPADQLRFTPPDRWDSMDTYLLHLSREHDLAYGRGVGGTRLFNREEVNEALEDCLATCAAGKTTAHRAEIDTRLAAGRKAAKRMKQPPSTEATKQKPRSPVKAILGTQQPRGAKPGVNRSAIEEFAAQAGLVTSWQICARYGQLDENGVSNPVFLALIKRHGLVARNRAGHCPLYNPQQADAVAQKLDRDPIQEWPSYVDATPKTLPTRLNPPKEPVKNTLSAQEFLVGRKLGDQVIAAADVPDLEAEMIANYRLEADADGTYRRYRLELAWQMMRRDT